VAGGVAGGAAAEFLQNREGGGPPQPSQLPAEVGDRVGQRPGAGEGPGIKERPATGERPDVGERPGVKERPGAGERPEVGDRLDNRGDRIDNAGDRIANRGDRIDNRATKIENRSQWRDNRYQRRDEVRNQVRRGYPRLNFWTNYPGWARWRVTRPYRWATWAGLTGWFRYGWSDPVYYYYGDNVYYEGDTVYYGDQAYCSSTEYAQQAEQIVASAPEADPEQGEWMSLGVWALTQDGQASGPEPTMFLQLVVSKEGIISGTFNNAATDTTQPIEGMVDGKTQRAAWTVVDQSRPLMETGVYNLTEDQAAALIHFADGQTQQWLLVRLEDPEGSGTSE
jgi:hypothetical protein